MGSLHIWEGTINAYAYASIVGVHADHTIKWKIRLKRPQAVMVESYQSRNGTAAVGPILKGLKR